MLLPNVKDLEIGHKRVLLRTDYDVPLSSGGRVADETRIEESLPTVNYLLQQKAKVIILSHLDRPGGKPVSGLSLKPVMERLTTMLDKIKIAFSQEVLGEKTKELAGELKEGQILVLENLRFEPGEEANDSQFALGLAALAEVYINDAFAVAHRPHASMIGLPPLLPSAFGFDFLEEIKVLSQVRENPKRPVVVVLGGVKRGKINAAKKLTPWADFILVGGDLIEYDGIPAMVDRHERILGNLTKKGEDITMETVEKFKEVIFKAGTIIWSGPMGAFEEEKFARGTKEIAQAIAASQAYSVVGGGDTEAALTKFGLTDQIDIYFFWRGSDASLSG
jgi:phosphoglycerate kinase